MSTTQSQVDLRKQVSAITKNVSVKITDNTALKESEQYRSFQIISLEIYMKVARDALTGEDVEKFKTAAAKI